MGQSSSLSVSNYTFRGQRANEIVYLVVRQHSWTLLPLFIVWLVMIGAIILSFSFFGASGVSSIVLVGAVIFGILYTLYCYFIWSSGLYIITNQRVIRVKQVSLFNRQISEAEIQRIQEISTEINGPIKTMLNFGTVKIQTASTTGKVDLENVPDPYDIQQVIVRLQQEIGGAAPAATGIEPSPAN